VENPAPASLVWVPSQSARPGLHRARDCVRQDQSGPSGAVKGNLWPLSQSVMSPAVVLSHLLPRRTSDAQRDLFDEHLG
jgi:hypothetical protein